MREYGSPLDRDWEGVGIRPVAPHLGADARDAAETRRSIRGGKGASEPVRARSRRAARPADISGAALQILEKLNRGVLVIDDHGTVLFMNDAAELMFKKNSGLLLRGRGLAFERSTDHAALEQFLERGCSTPDCPSLVLAVDGKKLASPYRVLVSPLSDGTSGNGRAARYSVFVYEPNGGQKPLPAAMLRNLYGLTPAEARLVNALFKGLALGPAAKSCGVSINTAKSTLKSVFAKCAVGSRAELLLLLSLGPRTL